MGSPLYMSPEQIRSAKNVDARADIWSLGVILYELTSGALPFEADTLGELFEHVFTKSVTPLREKLPGVAPELDAVVMRCLAKEPAARFATVAELAAALGRVAACSSHPHPILSTASFDGPPQVAAAVTGPITTLGNASAASSLGAASPQPRARGPAIAVAALAAVLTIAGAAIVLKTVTNRTPTSAAATQPISPAPDPRPPPPEHAPEPTLEHAPTPTPAPTPAPTPTPTPTPAPTPAPAPAPAPTPTPAHSSKAPKPPPAAKPASPKPPSADPFGSPD